MYIFSVVGDSPKGFGNWSEACAPGIDEDLRADEGEGVVVADPDLDDRVMISPELPHWPWLVPAAGRL